VRFEQRLRDGIHSGAIVLAFRRWKRSQVVPGHRYRTGIDMVEVESVDVVEPSSVDAAQAREAGYASVGELLADLRGDPALPVYRIRLRRIRGPDPRDKLARAASLTEADVAATTARLARMDKSSSRGPWTGTVLALIADRPGIVSTVLAEANLAGYFMIWVAEVPYLLVINPDHENRIPDRILAGAAGAGGTSGTAWGGSGTRRAWATPGLQPSRTGQRRVKYTPWCCLNS
jgi:hypothetical protein